MSMKVYVSVHVYVCAGLKTTSDAIPQLLTTIFFEKVLLLV